MYGSRSTPAYTTSRPSRWEAVCALMTSVSCRRGLGNQRGKPCAHRHPCDTDWCRADHPVGCHGPGLQLLEQERIIRDIRLLRSDSHGQELNGLLEAINRNENQKTVDPTATHWVSGSACSPRGSDRAVSKRKLTRWSPSVAGKAPVCGAATQRPLFNADAHVAAFMNRNSLARRYLASREAGISPPLLPQLG